MTKTTFLLAILAFAAGSILSSCNTTAGMGQDIQKMGIAVERSAEKTGGTN